MTVTLYIIAFVLGPALFLLLVRQGGRLWPPALIAFITVALSFVLRKEAGVAIGPLFLSVFLIWMAWILVLVLVVRGVHRAYPDTATRVWTQALGAMGTTVPWFGFAAARMMAE